MKILQGQLLAKFRFDSFRLFYVLLWLYLSLKKEKILSSKDFKQMMVH